ncbi:MAG: T9SS type A sorting domain-containing protein [Elusimicrobia bacterium]|nr:T9SS type A sorting domain-containing protein [Candidatus Liberimonas magnetica]
MFFSFRKPTSTTVLMLFIVPVLFAAAMVGTNYILTGPLMTAAGGTGTSPSYQVVATVGQTASGNAESPSFKADSGSAAQQQTVVLPPPTTDLNSVFVYPNPLKPGSGGLFDASTITFKKLTHKVTIKIYTYNGMLVKTINKNDATVDYYQWDTIDENGAKVSSGIYIYLITNANGEKAKGKFGIIR